MIPSKPMTFLAVLALAGCAGGTTVAQNSAGPSDTAGVTAAPAPAPAAEAEPASAAGSSALSFSSAQADRGRNVFRSTCTECHYSSEFSDRQFKFKWRRRTAGDLYEYVSTSMPEDAPGSLELQQYADIVAFVLRENGFEPGSGELPPDQTALETLSLAPLGN